MLLQVSAWLCEGLDSLLCRDSIKGFNIAIMRGCLILFVLPIPKQPQDKCHLRRAVRTDISLAATLSALCSVRASIRVCVCVCEISASSLDPVEIGALFTADHVVGLHLAFA